MWVVQGARGERPGWTRFATSTALAVITHAAVVLALPTPDGPRIEDTFESATIATIDFDPNEPIEATAGGAPTGPTNTPITAAPMPIRSARRREPAPATAGDKDASQTSIDATTPAPALDGAAAEVMGAVDGAADALGNGTASGVASGSQAGFGSAPASGGTGARLLGHGDPCAGYFPAMSSASRGQVSITVEIDVRGFVIGSQVVDVIPPGAGFSQAAHACVSRLRFTPATTPQGAAIESRTTLRLSFQRTLSARQGLSLARD